jgi:hypothetical protein
LFAARLAGKVAEELEELKQGQEGKDATNAEKDPVGAVSRLVTHIKQWMFTLLGNLGFFGILAFASVSEVCSIMCSALVHTIVLSDSKSLV